MGDAKDLHEVFKQHHADHPELYMILAFLARDAIARKQKFGIQTLWEVARYSFAMTGESGPAFDDRLRPYYARFLMQTEPDIDGFFTTRVLRRE